MKAVVIGPGRIGCGLAGELVRGAGCEVVFAARRQEVVDHLNRVGRYTIRIAHGNGATERMIAPVRAVWTGAAHRVAEEISDADVVITAVGAGNLPGIASVIANGLRRRDEPVNILTFENLGRPCEYLRSLVEEILPRELVEPHGFSGVMIDRVVTQRLGDPAGDEPFVFVGDAPAEIVVDAANLRAPLPQIATMIVAENYQAWIERKLFTFSAGHAATAYLGFLKGYHYIHTAICDPEIRHAVLEAMTEGQRGLAARYGSEVAGDERDLLDIVARFENAALNDPIRRVGRDPRRKLGPHDRLVGAARLAEQAGVSPKSLSLAVAAALCFCSTQSIAGDEVLRQIQLPEGPQVQVETLDCRCKLDHLVADTWARLGEGWREDNLLLSLEGLLWAWRAEASPTPELVSA
jgi:mannitol-1-phosphate 5-dehydrogenase